MPGAAELECKANLSCLAEVIDTQPLLVVGLRFDNEDAVCGVSIEWPHREGYFSPDAGNYFLGGDCWDHEQPAGTPLGFEEAVQMAESASRMMFYFSVQNIQARFKDFSWSLGRVDRRWDNKKIREGALFEFLDRAATTLKAEASAAGVVYPVVAIATYHASERAQRVVDELKSALIAREFAFLDFKIEETQRFKPFYIKQSVSDFARTHLGVNYNEKSDDTRVQLGIMRSFNRYVSTPTVQPAWAANPAYAAFMTVGILYNQGRECVEADFGV